MQGERMGRYASSTLELHLIVLFRTMPHGATQGGIFFSLRVLPRAPCGLLAFVHRKSPTRWSRHCKNSAICSAHLHFVLRLLAPLRELSERVVPIQLWKYPQQKWACLHTYGVTFQDADG